MVAVASVVVGAEDEDESVDEEEEDPFFGVVGHSVVAVEPAGGNDEVVVGECLDRMGLMRDTSFVEVLRQWFGRRRQKVMIKGPAVVM